MLYWHILYIGMVLACCFTCMQGSELVKARLEVLQAVVAESVAEDIAPSITCDIWSSRSHESFLSFTMHVIDKRF